MKAVLQEIHPGEMLREEFMAPLGLSYNELSEALDAPREEFMALLAEKGPVTAVLARALAAYFKVSMEFWLNLQADYDARIENGGRQ